jgi:Secretion system C-terminal sorting domain
LASAFFKLFSISAILTSVFFTSPTQGWTVGTGGTILLYKCQASNAGLATSNQTDTKDVALVSFYGANSCSNLIAKTFSNGASPVSGNTTAKVWLETVQPPQYVKRHYEITPAVNATTATGQVTLYFTQTEFDNFNAVNVVKLPANANDAAGKANLLIEKRGGVSSNGTGLPGTYTGTVTTINPVDANIVWNTSQSRWEVSFNVTGFSGFFVKTSTFVLPLRLINFSAIRTNNINNLQWKTADEINTKEFIVERSDDGVSFIQIASVAALATGSNTYQYSDNYIKEGKVYYRLRMVDNDGKFTYSNILVLKGGNFANAVLLYPNPAKDFITVSGIQPNGLIAIKTITGIQIQQVKTASNSEILDISRLNSGTYIISYSYKNERQQLKFIKR